MRSGASTSTRPSAGCRPSRSRSTAGRGTTSAGSRTPARRSAAAWRSPATIPARPARPTSSAPTSTRPSRSCPARHRLNLHASYAETGGRKVERDALEPEHFRGWIDWAKSRRIGMDFNPTYFAHPLAADGYTLAHPDRGRPPVLDRSRDRLPPDRRRDRQGAGHRPASPTSGSPTARKDTPIDRKGPRERLAESLDADLRRAARPEVQPRRRRGQALRPRLGELRRRLARVLPRLRHHAQEAPVPRRRPLSSDRGRLRQDLGRAPATSTRSCCTSAAASAGTATTS